MNKQEFIEGFNLLYNNISSNAAPGVDELEMSILLTKAQDEILKNHLVAISKEVKGGIDATSKRQIDFSNITVTEKLIADNTVTNKLHKNSLVFNLPKSLLYIMNERVKIQDKILTVVAVDYLEYDRLTSRVYKYPTKNQVWRIITFPDKVEVIFPSNITTSMALDSYLMRYIRKPKDIDVTDSGDENPCEVDEILHQEILQRAVEIAKVTYFGTVENIIQTGSRSE